MKASVVESNGHNSQVILEAGNLDHAAQIDKPVMAKKKKPAAMKVGFFEESDGESQSQQSSFILPPP